MENNPTQKTLSILKKLIEISGNPGDILLECFMGVGSRAVAAKELDRQFIGCELEKKYYKYLSSRLTKPHLPG